MSHAVLPIRIGEQWVAIDAFQVQEILGARPWIALPGSPSNVPGVFPWRGRAIAVLDLGAMAQIAPPLDPAASHSRAVVVQAGANTMAILVDGAREVQEVPADRVHAPHATRGRYAVSEADILSQSGDRVPVPIVDLHAMIEIAAAAAPEAA